MIHKAVPGTIQRGASGPAQGWFVYLVECIDGTIYTGCTTNVTRRIDEHNGSNRGAKYTRSRRPVKLLAAFPSATRSTAQSEESQIKKLTRAQKLALIKMIMIHEDDS